MGECPAEIISGCNNYNKRATYYKYLLKRLREGGKIYDICNDIEEIAFIVSPKVYKALVDYINAGHAILTAGEEKRKEIDYDKGFFKSFLRSIAISFEVIITGGVKMPPLYDAIVDAICWELEVSKTDFFKEESAENKSK